MKALKNTADSALTGAQFAQPGVVEVVLTQPIAATILGALEGTISGNPREIVTAAGIAGGIGSSTHPFIIVHDSVHAYSASSDHVGLLPRQLVQVENRD